MKVAVLTDAPHDGFYFPLWYRYYKSAFGAENLFVITYGDSNFKFSNYVLGGSLKIPSPYHDTLRCKTISSFCSTLLCYYDYVVRVDTDEFLVADPRIHKNIRDLIFAIKSPYLTSIGLDVIQSSDELPLDISSDILVTQRRYAYPNSSLNKTSIVSLPTTWTEGFHFCNHFPKTGGVYLIHLKRADIDQQIAWANKMVSFARDNSFLSEYYSVDRDRILRYREDVFHRPRFQGWSGLSRGPFVERFFSSVIPYKTGDGQIIYSGSHFHDDILVELPAEFSGRL